MGRGADARRQRGAALLLLLALSGVLAVVVVLNLLSAGAPSAQERERVTQEALGRAKQALIAYVVRNVVANGGDPIGQFPCPAYQTPPEASDNFEGQANSVNCGSRYQSVVGRLPWKTLGSDPLRDGYGECLWYVVSGNFKNGSSAGANLINWDTLGQLEVLAYGGTGMLAGDTAITRAAAVIIAPGPPLQQDRTPVARTPNCPGNHDAAQYLESLARLGADNTLTMPPVSPPAGTLGGSLSRLISGYTDATTGNTLVHDRMIVITPKEIFDAIEQWHPLVGYPAELPSEIPKTRLRLLTKRVAECLAEFPSDRLPGESSTYRDRRLPWAAVLSPTDFALDSTYSEADGLSVGRVPAYLGVTAAPNPPLSSPPGPLPPYIPLNAQYFEKYCSHWSEIANLFQHWKDHLFYAVAPDFDHTNGQASATECGSGCLTVNDGQPASPPPAAAVVIFAGRPLIGQTRALSSERSAPGNYLEGRNLQRILDPTSGRDHQTADSATFNDVLYCIRFTTGTLWNDKNGNKIKDEGEEYPSARVPKVDPC